MQSRAQKPPEGRRDEDRNHGVYAGNDSLLGDDGQHCGEGKTKQEAVLDKAFGKIEEHIGECAAKSAKQTAPMRGQIRACDATPGCRNFSAEPCHDEFEDEGEGGGGDVGGIGQVEKHGADARGKPAIKGAQKQAGKQAQHISHMDSCAVDGRGDRDLQEGGSDIDRRRHDAGQGDFFQRNFFHAEYSPFVCSLSGRESMSISFAIHYNISLKINAYNIKIVCMTMLGRGRI